MQKVAAIVNAGSGVECDNDALIKRIRERFIAHGIRAEVHCISSGTELLETVAALAESDVDVIVAGGGDGTISAVASEVAKTNKTLGVLPLGTLNHFSKDLGISQVLNEAIATIAKGHVELIDVGEVNGQIFINNSSIGLYPRIVRKRKQQQEKLKRGKWPAAFWAAIAMLRRYPFLDVQLKIGGQTIKRKTPFVFVGNNEYQMQGFRIGARSRLNDGKLSLYVLHRTSRIGLLILAARSILGVLKEAKDFDEFLVEDIVIETRKKKKKGLLVAFDGEIAAMSAPLKYRIRPGALKVIVPQAETRQ